MASTSAPPVAQRAPAARPLPPRLRSRVAWGALTLALLAGVVAIEYVTGEEIGFTAFYFGPVFLATWFVGLLFGILVCTASGVSVFFLELTWESGRRLLFVSEWNAFIAFVGFLIVALISNRLKQAVEHEKTLSALKSRFIGMASHDLRNPLSSIMGYMQLLEARMLGPLEEPQRKAVEVAHLASQRMLSLIDSLLDVTVIESGRLDLDLRPGSLARVVREQVEAQSILAERKKIRFDLDLEEGHETVFDPSRISQVIDNLVGNAVKFSKPGSAVRVSLRIVDGRSSVSVSDQGPGLTPEDRAGLFQPFAKLSARPTGGERSTGLGLFIVKTIVEAHRGEVSVEGSSSTGTTFTFSLPSPNPSARARG
jgi:signal transduction histidine kinase